MAEVGKEWEQLAALLTRQRVVVLGQRSRAAFVRSRGLSSDRVIDDLENARRANYSVETLLSLESWYGLTAEQLRAVLGDLYPDHDIATVHALGTIQSKRVNEDEAIDLLASSIDDIRAMLDAMATRLDDLHQVREDSQ
jgi:prefoldin subunit 5